MKNSMAKKILVIHSSAQISGAEKSLIDVLNILKQQYDVTLILPGKGEMYSKLCDSFNIQIFAVTGLERKTSFIKLLKNCYHVFITNCRIYRFVRKEKTDLIYCNTTQAAIYSMLTSILTNTKNIWHVRDNLPNKTMGAILAYFSDKMICISHHIYRQLPLPKNKIVLHNGIDTVAWKLSHTFPTRLRRELGIDSNTILVGQIGQLIPWKNHSLLIEIAKRVIAHNKHVHFVIIGRDMLNAYPEYKNRLNEKIQKENLHNHLSILDFTENIKKHMEELDILIHLAVNEPFGRVIIEAMALEKPVIAMNNGGPVEIVCDSRSGYLIKTPDADSIAAKLDTLLTDATLRKKFGIEGRKIITEKFNIDNLEKIKEIIAALL